MEERGSGRTTRVSSSSQNDYQAATDVCSELVRLTWAPLISTCSVVIPGHLSLKHSSVVFNPGHGESALSYPLASSQSFFLKKKKQQPYSCSKLWWYLLVGTSQLLILLLIVSPVHQNNQPVRSGVLQDQGCPPLVSYDTGEGLIWGGCRFMQCINCVLFSLPLQPPICDGYWPELACRWWWLWYIYTLLPQLSIWLV